MSGRRILSLVAANVLAVAVLLEVGARVLSLDERLLAPLLLYQVSDSAVQQAVPDTERLYDLRPSSAAEATGAFGRRTVRVNSLGLRGAERSAAKPPGVFRIIVFGASNAYGAEVSDDETFPAHAERLLNEAGDPCSYEVWNAAVNAYIPSQSVAKARRLLEVAEADLLLFQLYRHDRRAFHSTGGSRPWQGIDIDDLSGWLRADPGLWRENVAWVPLAGSRPGLALFEASAAWRALVLASNHFGLPPNHDAYGIHDWVPEVEAFRAEFGGRIPIAFFGMVPWLARDLDVPQAPPDPSLAPPAGDPSYGLTHPPGHVYAWYARVLRSELTRLGFLPCGGGRSRYGY